MSKITKFGSIHEDKEGGLIFKDFSIELDHIGSYNESELARVMTDLIIERLREPITGVEIKGLHPLNDITCDDLKWEFRK